MLGLPGSGKTTYSKQLQRELGITRLSLDEEYSKLGGNLHNHKWNEKLAEEANESIRSKVQETISRKESVILDFCPWTKSERFAYRDFIESTSANCHIYYFDVPIEELKRRLSKRNENLGSDEHVVTPDMLDAFIKRFDPPNNERYELI